MSRDSDYVVDSKLDTRFESSFTVHIFRDHSLGQRRRAVAREEYWQREHRVGGGAYGSIWFERCVQGHRDIDFRAVKQISTRPSRNGSSIDYARELEAFAKFSRDRYVDCFVKSFGWYEGDEVLFIAMEYLPLGDLQRYMHNSAALPEEAAQDITCQILEGISFMHENRFAHRDLKPGNILIKSCPPNPWWVKIGDFGISKRLEDETEQSTLFKGTLGFIAPEIHGFVPVGSLLAADMWALGEISFQLMTKEPVFGNIASFADYVRRTEPFPTAVLLENKISLNAEDFITSLMDPFPERRLTAEQAQKHDWINQFLMQNIEPVLSPPAADTTASPFEEVPRSTPTSSTNTTIDVLGTWTSEKTYSSVPIQATVTTDSQTAMPSEKTIDAIGSEEAAKTPDAAPISPIATNEVAMTEENEIKEGPPTYDDTMSEVRFTKKPKNSPRWRTYARYGLGNMTFQTIRELYEEKVKKGTLPKDTNPVVSGK